MSIKNWPKFERPREKLLANGVQVLSNAELVAIFLRTGAKGKSAVDLARELLSQFGNLQNLLAASQKEFCQNNGVGSAKYVQLQAVLEISRRYLFEEMQNSLLLTNSRVVKEYLVAQIGGYQHEIFGCLFLNNKHRLICFRELFQGSIDHIQVYPREIVKEALALNAAAVIFAHNHPSGDITPSRCDREVTEVLEKALQPVAIRLLDHVIVAGNRTFSFSESGWLG
jgi:DNA repair protein RadC